MPTEILQERTRFTKTFALDESTRRIEFSDAPFHYRDKYGQWNDIRTTFLDEGEQFSNRENMLKSMIAPEGVTLENEEGDSLTFRVKELRYVGKSGQVDLIAPAGKPVYQGLHKARSGEQYVIHTGFLPGVFSEYTVEPARVKHNLHILRPIRKPSFSEPYWLELVFSITGSAAFEFVRYGETIQDEVSSIDELGIRFEERIFRLPAPFLTDNDGNCFPVQQKLRRLSPNEAVFSYLISDKVLGHQDLVYPLLIDPTVSVSGMGTGEEKTWPCQFIHTVSWSCDIRSHSFFGTAYFQITMANGTVKVDRSATGIRALSESDTFQPTSAELGTCRIRVWGSDEYSGGSGSVTYQVDETAPSISFSISSRSWSNANASVTVTLSDSQSGVDAYRYAWSTSTSKPGSGWTDWTTGSSFSATQSSDDSWYLHVEARDKAGNISYAYAGPYQVDKTAPSISFNPSSSNWTNGNITVSASITDSGGSGFSQRRYAWSTSTTAPTSGWSNWESGASFQVTQSSEGVYYLFVEARDVAGNVRQSYGGPYRIDKTAPSVSFSISSRPWANTDVSVTVSASDNVSGVSTLQYAWSTSTTTPSSWTNFTSGSALTQSSTGQWYLHIKAIDAAGNTRTTYAGPYQVDKTAPTISFNPSSTNWSTSASVTISVSVSDSLSGPKDIRYAWSTSTSKPSSGWSSWTTGSSLPVTQSSEGTWYLHVEARDSADNLAYAYAGPYRIDRTAPAISFDVTSTPWGAANVTVSVTVTDSGGSGVNQYRYAWSTSTSEPSSGWTSWASGSSFAASQSSSGSWYLHVEASDAVGNIGYTYAGPYRIDKDAPSITFSKEPSLTPQSVVSVPVTISDGNGSGVKERRYAWSPSTAKPSSDWSSWASGSSFTASKAASGTWYLHVEAKDNVDNLRYAYTGPFVVKVHEGLLGWWKLDGNAEDASGNGFHGTLSGSASFAQGKIGQALSMGSSSGQIVTPIPDDSIPDTFTVTVCVRIKQWGLSQGVFGTRYGSTNTGFMLYRNSGDADGLLRTYLHYTNTSGTSTTTSHSYTGFPLNEWFHVAVVRGQGYYKTYFNGQLVGSSTLSNFQHWNKGSTTFRIGSGGTSYASAQMDVDDVRLYDRELSGKEIKELAKAKILHYKFDDFQEPTENLHSITLTPGGSWSGSSAFQVTDLHGQERTWHKRLERVSTTNSYTTVNIPCEPNTWYTFSVYLRGIKISPGCYVRIYLSDNTVSTHEYVDCPITHEWQRFSVSRLTASNATSIVRASIHFGNNHVPVGDVIEIADWQLEKKPHATPFTPGTRGGVVLDSSGYENHAALSISTTPQWSSDSAIGSGAYKFDGAAQYIDIGRIGINATDDLTLAAWVKLDPDFSSDGCIIGGRRGDVTNLRVLPDRRLEGRQDDYAVVSSKALDLNKRHHVALTFKYDASTSNAVMKLYVDGEEAGTRNITGYDDTFTNIPMWIGWESRYNDYFKGLIDDVRVYKTALSAQDIKELYQQRASIDHRGNVHVTEIVETGYRPSLIDYRTWQIGATSAPGFNRNGSAHENLIIEGTDPWGNKTAIWEAIPDGSNNADGGWNTPRFSIDNTKTYRFSVWVNRTVMGSDGSFYLGCHGYGSVNGVVTRSGSVSTNPYFYSGRDLPEGEWVLVVGHVHPHHLSSFSVHPDTGIWRLNGTKIRSINDFQWLPETIEATHRTYLYYTTDTTVRQRWCYPRVDVCDGNEPTLADLLSGRPYLYDDIPGPMSLTDRLTCAPKISEVGVVAGISAWYPLREDVFDISGSKNHLTVNGPSLSTVSGRLGLFFDGVDDWAQIAQPIQFPGDQNAWTVTGWIYPTQSGWIISPRSSGNDHGIIYDESNRRLRFYITEAADVGNRSRYSLNGSVPLNQWSHFACSLEGLLVRIYINGELQYEGTETDPIALWSGAWDLGRRAAATNYFGGYLSDLRIYRRALSPQEVGILYKATRPNPVLMQQTASGLYIAGQFIEV